MEMERRTSIGFPEIKGQDYKSTGTLSSERKEKFRVETNASGHTIGEVLSQE